MDRNTVCKVIGNAERLQLILCLTKAQTVTDLLSHCSLSQSALSQHLKVLRDAGVVTTEREGKYVFYKVTDIRLVKIAKMIVAYTS